MKCTFPLVDEFASPGWNAQSEEQAEQIPAQSAIPYSPSGGSPDLTLLSSLPGIILWLLSRE